MNVETLKLIVAAIIMAIVLCVFRLQVVGSYCEWFSAKRRAGELLRSVLTREQYCQLIQRATSISPAPVIKSAPTVCHEVQGL